MINGLAAEAADEIDNSLMIFFNESALASV